MQLKTFFVQDRFGNVQPGAKVYVYERGTQNLVSGLKDAAGQALSNPVVADAQGAVSIVADDGIYSVRTVSAMHDITVDMQFVDMHAAAQAAQAALDGAERAAESANFVASHAGNIATVAGNISDLQLVAGNVGTVNVVAAGMASVDEVARVMPDVAAAANQMLLASESSGPVFANTYAEMSAHHVAAPYSESTVIEVLADETSGDERTRYTVSQGQLFGPVLIMDYARRSILAAAGAGLVGFQAPGGVLRNLHEKSTELLSVQDFGVNLASHAPCHVELQAAMDYAASVGGKLIVPRKSVLFIGAGLVIPSGLIADFGNSTIVRQPGAVFNMMSNATGGDRFHIENLIIDGNRQADGRVAINVDDRFGGIVLNGVTHGELRNVWANNTVNAEDGRAGIYIQDSVVGLYNVGGEGNDRSCVLIKNSRVKIFAGKATDNLGSGFTSAGADDSEFYDLEATGSGYSGISINGKRCRAVNLRATRTAVGYAGINIGHDSAGNRSDDSIIEGVHSYDNYGWGMTITGSKSVVASGVNLSGNGRANLRISGNADSSQISGMVSKNSAEHGVIITSGHHKITDSEVYGNGSHGIDVEAGSSANISKTVRSFNNGKMISGGAGVLLNGSVGSTVDAECFDNQSITTQEYGVWLNGGRNSIGGKFTGNKTLQIRETGGAVYANTGMRTGTDAMRGAFVAPQNAATVDVSNNNARPGMAVIFYPLNAATGVKAIPTLGAVVAGVSFVANLGYTASGAEAYGYVII